jgi:hypothetical protein
MKTLWTHGVLFALIGCSYWSNCSGSLQLPHKGSANSVLPCFKEVLWSLCKFRGCEFSAHCWDLCLPASESCPYPSIHSVCLSNESDVQYGGSHGCDALIIVVSSSTWKLARNANSAVLSQTDWVRKPWGQARHLCFQGSPDDSHIWSSFENSDSGSSLIWSISWILNFKTLYSASPRA